MRNRPADHYAPQAWKASLSSTRHGFRGPLGTATGNADAIGSLLSAEVDAILPMPDAGVMLSLLPTLSG
ncbi:hypothetical protein CO659_13240 [Rhizobium sp. S9]|uniref:hypothetical protein n=1 Tax=unclassified Rhizobium TaxID=2613769 RepID=UPI000A268D3D|nr:MULTISPECIES: hypothetical protein [unclassified Rhizobium]PDS97616.1 hypothetical protein CO659_13240 [Rhizobium sp. S9]